MMLNSISRPAPHRRMRPSPRIISGTMALVAAGLIAAGTALPWLSFFAGLQPRSGVGTLNGTMLLAGAAVAVLLAVATLASRSRWPRRGLTILGIVLTAFSAYLVVGLVAVYREVSADPLLVVQVGPGLALVAAGSLIVLLTGVLSD